jgi:aspartate/methionine/tyrosine aminotransferase
MKYWGKNHASWTSPLNDTLASIYSQRFQRQLFASKNVLVTSGARDGLHSTLNALLREGD